MARYWKYKTQQGDTFDSISLDFYKDEAYSGNIIQANPDHVDVLIFDSGVELKIPVIEKPKANTLPPWKR